ncbi:MAG: subtilisin-like proprotein convertase family protein, partial [Saprospiraceae bacterium]
VEWDLVTEEDSCGITGIQVYRFTFTDNCGNSSTTEGTFTIEDTTPPVIMGGENYSGECDQSNANNDDELLSWLNNRGGATADDMCGNIVWSNNYDVANFEDGCNDSRNIDVTFTATDECSNFSEITLNFSTGDSTPPVFTNCPRPPVVVDAPEGWCSSFVNFSLPLATDNCGVPIVTQTDNTGLSTGDEFPVGLTILEFTATDSCGNQTVCELKIVVNDFHTPPTITCAEDVETVNDPGKCGAVVNDISAIAEDNCPDNLAIVFEVKDEFGLTIAEGIEDASGIEFPGGTSTVIYTVFDQPILLITEILQDGTTSGAEISNLGPATVDVSCASMTRNANGVIDTFDIPNGTILTVGDVYTHDFATGAGAGDVATYTIFFIDNMIDAITVNSDGLNGDNIFRIDPVDNDDATDWEVANPCNLGSYGTFNPQLPTFTDNGGQTSLQGRAPSSATCSFTVTVVDIEAPMCATQDTMTFVNTDIIISDGICIVSSEVVVNGGSVGEVNVRDFLATIDNAGAITAQLTSPAGTEIILFSELCEGTADIDVSLDDMAPSSILAAGCSPLGNGSTFKPQDAFKAFFGEEAAGTWTLEIFSGEPVNGTLDSWTLDVITNEAYAQMDTLISNDPTVCEAEFTWIHPVFSDNCCEGSMTVTYDFSNDVTGIMNSSTENLLTPSGFIDLDGTEVTRIFEVGTTIITYTLIDLAGNESNCGFTVIVEDDEVPMFPNGCGDLEIGLEPGNCTASLPFANRPLVTDNCAIDSIRYVLNGEDLDVDFIPIGMNEITLIVVDIYGNVNSCTFTVNVIEFIPENSTLSCNNGINLSLGVDCTVTLNADIILEGGPYRCYDNYCIEVTNAAGNIVDSTFDLSDVNQTFQVSITDCLGSGNSCWGYVTIEEKLLPEIECPADIELTCNQDPDARHEAGHPLAGQLITGELTLFTCEPIANVTYLDDIIDNGTCSDPRVLINRRWRLVDNSGNSVTCDQLITFFPYDPLNVIFPSDFTLNNALSCGDVAADPTLTEPNNTGRPSLNGEPIIGSNYCDINLGFWDEVLQDVNCPAGYELLRHWTISNECLPITPGVNPLVHIQRIKVDDNTAPTLLPVDDVTISTNAWECFGTYVLPAIVHDDDCSSYEVKWNISYGQVDDGVIYNLLPGVTDVTARVTDGCGNAATRSFTITTIDGTAPVVIALQNIVIGLTSTQGGGTAKLFAGSVDNGSHDNCGNVKIEIRRDTDQCNFNGNITYNADGHSNDGSSNPNSPNYDPDEGAYVKFCCDDIYNAEVDINDDGELDPGYVKVWMRVWDDGNGDGIYGNDGDNFNEAWSFVKVEDKLAPQITCPADVTITCDMDRDDLSVAGEAIGFGSCGTVVVEYNDIIENLSTCNEGFVRRRWSIVGRTDIFCDQTITTEGIESTPVTVSFSQVGDFNADGCPDDIAIGEPTWSGSPCDQIGYAMETDTFLFEDGACYKLVNHFTIINWCTYDPNDANPIGIWEHTQVVKVTDNTLPAIENCEDQMYAVNDHDDSDNDGNKCEGMITLVNVATDPGSENCPTGWLKWQVFIDLWGDGTNDYEFSSFLPPFDNNFNDSNNNGIPDKFVAPTANGEQVSIPLPDIEGSMSNHKVSWTVTDGCQNVTSCSSNFMVVDKKTPTPYCINVSSAVMASNGTLDIWAVDFNLGSFDNCTADENLRYTFSDVAPGNDNSYDESRMSSSRTFTCDDVENSPVAVMMYVWDEKGNSDFCEVYLSILDNGNACGEGATIAGRLANVEGEGLEDADIILNAILPEYPRTGYSDEEGLYTFLGAPMSNTYEISAQKNNEYTNGVSTLDLVMIQRHILGLAEFDSPYKMVAGDINSDEKLKASDLVELRKLILGVILELPNNGSWRFIDQDQTFTNILDPWPLIESIELETTADEMMNNDFVSVKIGDVSGNASMNLTGIGESEVRGAPFEMYYNDRIVEEGEVVELTIHGNEKAELYGYQFTIESDGMSFEDMEADDVPMTESNVGVLSNSVITVSYGDVIPIDVVENSALFTMTFNAERSGYISEMIHMTSLVTSSEAYISNALNVKGIILTAKRDAETVSTNALYQNEPNPFKVKTMIGFELAEAGEVTFTVTDVAGKVLKVINTEGVKGYNSIPLDAEEFGITGVLYYTLESNDFTDTKKMIIVR